MELVKKVLIVLLNTIVNASNQTNCVFLSNQKWEIQSTLINLYPNEYNQELHYYAVKLDKCVGSWNTLNDLRKKVCVPNKTEDLNIYVFNIIRGKNETNIWIKDISYKCKCKSDGRKFNSNQWWNSDKCRCECQKHHICEKDYIWNPATCSCENEKYLASIIDDSVITCDEIIEETKTIPTNFNEKNTKSTIQNFYISLVFLLFIISLLIFSIYCYLIKYWAKQKYLLLFHDTNNELKQVLYW